MATSLMEPRIEPDRHIPPNDRGTMNTLFEPTRQPREIAPGAVHLPAWLDLEQQRHIVTAFEQWCAGPVPLRAATLPGGHQMSVETVCLGWHWQPYRYTRHADDVNGARVLDLPDWLVEFGRSAVVDAGYDPSVATGYKPDTALVNYYKLDAKLGMHQDKDERVDEPVVSLSVGDTCRFRFGNTVQRGKPYTDIDLASGDAFVFGGPARFAFHAVTKIYPATGSPSTGLTSGRINITMRVTGMT